MNRQRSVVYVVMGVSGSGKTTIGTLLAQCLGVPFYDADDFHRPESVEKMSKGIPLSDADRAPWLALLAGNIESWSLGHGAVLACSALKFAYREILTGSNPDRIRFIVLSGSESLIQSRLRSRKNHFMPASLLRSQIETLEMPDNALVASINSSPEQIVQQIIEQIGASDAETSAGVSNFGGPCVS